MEHARHRRILALGLGVGLAALKAPAQTPDAEGGFVFDGGVSTSTGTLVEPASESSVISEVPRSSFVSSDEPLASSVTATVVPPAPPPPRLCCVGADSSPRVPRSEQWDVWGEGRLRLNQSTAFGVDTQGTSANQRTWLQSRIVAGGRWAPSQKLRFDLELDGLSGYLAGDPMALGTVSTSRPFQLSPSGADRTRIIPRKANVLWTTRVGQVALGAQTFSWGTGMLANDGAGAAQTDGLQFGDAWMGNVVARMAFLTKPFREWNALKDFALFIAGDLVLRDDNASVFDGDLAGAALLGARLDTERTSLGVLVVGRSQVDRVDPFRPGAARSQTTVAITNLYGRQRLRLDSWQQVTAEAELTLIAGRSTRPLTDETLSSGAEVLQWGGLLRARWDSDRLRVSAQLEGGYASGDNDPRDRIARTFSMNSDHNVGLVLFDHVLPMVTARAVDQLANPSLSGTPPPSTRFLVNNGAVQNAIYVHPVIKWRPHDPLELKVGYVYAVAAADFADAWQSTLNGGFSATPGGRVLGGRGYGHELDARVAWTQPLWADVRLLVGAEGGLFIPGSVFEGIQGLGTPWLLRGLASVRW